MTVRKRVRGWACLTINQGVSPRGNLPTGMSELFRLAELIASSRTLVVLTGAGCSTRSGIPDYRSPGGAWTRHKPIYYNDFVRSEDVRRFYWARSFRGWPRFLAARPNAAHHAIAQLEARGTLDFLITQNVDDLHQEAGS